jgi:hypothetical protein
VPHLPHRAIATAMNFAVEVERLRKPMELLDVLDRYAAAIASVNVFCVWQWSNNLDDYVVGKSVFYHRTVPPTFMNEFLALRQEHGPSIVVRKIWNNAGPFTFTEALREMRPTGADRWIFDLCVRYGMRDGLYCCYGRWIVLFASKKILR